MGTDARPHRSQVRRPLKGSAPGSYSILALGLVGIALLILPACGGDEGGRQVLRGKGKLLFTPLSDFPSDLLKGLVGYYENKYGWKIETTPPIPLDSSVADLARRQLIAEEIIALMKRTRRDLADDPETILIGFTVYDTYIRGEPNWRWAFSLREEGRFAMISTARMDPKVFPSYSGPPVLQILKAILDQRYGIPLRDGPDSVVLQRRLRKMVSKTIGILYLGLAQSQDRRSVMYGPILGLDDLESMGENF